MGTGCSLARPPAARREGGSPQASLAGRAARRGGWQGLTFLAHTLALNLNIITARVLGRGRQFLLGAAQGHLAHFTSFLGFMGLGWRGPHGLGLVGTQGVVPQHAFHFLALALAQGGGGAGVQVVRLRLLLAQGVRAPRVQPVGRGDRDGDGAPARGRGAVVCGPLGVRAGSLSLSSSLHGVGPLVLHRRSALGRRRPRRPGRPVPLGAQQGPPRVLQLGVGQRRIAVPPFVPRPGHLGVDPHLLLVGLGLHRVARQVGVAPVARLVLLLPPLPLVVLPALRVLLVVVVYGVLGRVPAASPAGVPVT